MNIENRMKHNLEMFIRCFGKFIEDIEEYQTLYKDDEVILAHLQDILARKNPFNTDLMEILYRLYDYKEDIEESL